MESGRDVDVNRLLQSELALVPKSLATLDGSLREAGKSDLGTFCKEMSVRAKCPSARAKRALLLINWQLFSPSPLFRSKNLWGVECLISSYCHFPFFGQLYRFDVLFDRYVKNSINGETRDKREEKKSTGIRRNVNNRDQRMRNWERFIRER